MSPEDGVREGRGAAAGLGSAPGSEQQPGEAKDPGEAVSELPCQPAMPLLQHFFQKKPRQGPGNAGGLLCHGSGGRRPQSGAPA